MLKLDKRAAGNKNVAVVRARAGMGMAADYSIGLRRKMPVGASNAEQNW